MKKNVMMSMMCLCLLLGSFYPKMILEHHIKLVNEAGKELEIGEEYESWIPCKIRFRFLELFR